MLAAGHGSRSERLEVLRQVERRIAQLEDRVDELEGDGHGVVIVDERGIFLPGTGWIRVAS